MSGITNSSRIALRRQATVAQIIAAAWELSRENGLGNFSMRELGTKVGMKAQSIYSYFASKHEIFDAMFCDGNRALIETMQTAGTGVVGAGSDGEGQVELIAALLRRFFRFCTSDPVRYQLLFQRTIPNFAPSQESFAVAQEAYDVSLAPLRRLGLTGSELDLVTGVMAGLVAQQLSNDPTGDRWELLIDQATSMLLNELVPDHAAPIHKGKIK
jgi:AcrR family transcriptional regulator